MKSTILVLAALLSVSAFAGEAQLWPSKIVKVVKTEGSCRVFVDIFRLDDHPENPLDNNLMNDGIEVGVNKSGNCNREVGQMLSGYLSDEEGFVSINR